MELTSEEMAAIRAARYKDEKEYWDAYQSGGRRQPRRNDDGDWVAYRPSAPRPLSSAERAERLVAEYRKYVEVAGDRATALILEAEEAEAKAVAANAAEAESIADDAARRAADEARKNREGRPWLTLAVFSDQEFDLASLSDCPYQAEDDRRAAAEWRKVLFTDGSIRWLRANGDRAERPPTTLVLYDLDVAAWVLPWDPGADGPRASAAAVDLVPSYPADPERVDYHDVRDVLIYWMRRDGDMYPWQREEHFGVPRWAGTALEDRGAKLVENAKRRGFTERLAGVPAHTEIDFSRLVSEIFFPDRVLEGDDAAENKTIGESVQRRLEEAVRAHTKAAMQRIAEVRAAAETSRRRIETARLRVEKAAEEIQAAQPKCLGCGSRDPMVHAPGCGLAGNFVSAMSEAEE